MYHPLSDDVAVNLAALETPAAHGAVAICPYRWDDLGGENEVGCTVRGTAFDRTLRAFVVPGSN